MLSPALASVVGDWKKIGDYEAWLHPGFVELRLLLDLPRGLSLEHLGGARVEGDDAPS